MAAGGSSQTAGETQKEMGTRFPRPGSGAGGEHRHGAADCRGGWEAEEDEEAEQSSPRTPALTFCSPKCRGNSRAVPGLSHIGGKGGDGRRARPHLGTSPGASCPQQPVKGQHDGSTTASCGDGRGSPARSGAPACLLPAEPGPFAPCRLLCSGLGTSGPCSSGDAGGDPPCATGAVLVLDTSSHRGVTARRQPLCWIFSSSIPFIPRSQRTASPSFGLGSRPPRSPAHPGAELQQTAVGKRRAPGGLQGPPALLLSSPPQLPKGFADPPSPGSPAPMLLLRELTPSPRLPPD